jgi:hypothetical protein
MIRLRLVAPALVLTALAAACSSGSSGGSSAANTPPPTQAPTTAPATAPADEAAAKAEIKANWTKFYAYKTRPAVAASLLENGAQMAGALAFARLEQKQSHIKQAVKVNAITFTDATHAQVTYALLNGTTPLLPNATGVAVYSNGKWLVSKTSFCTLVQLGANGKTVPGC